MKRLEKPFFLEKTFFEEGLKIENWKSQTGDAKSITIAAHTATFPLSFSMELTVERQRMAARRLAPN